MVKEDSFSDRDRSRRSSKSGGPSASISSSSNPSNNVAKKPIGASSGSGSGDRLRPPVSTTSSLVRRMDEARLEKKRELIASAKVAVDFEEAEAGSRDPSADLTAFIQSCESIRDSLCKMKLGSDSDPVASEKHKNEVVAAFMELKLLNRYDKLRLKKARDGVNQVKETVDNYYLQLQNLLSEIMYIRKEITRCLEYKSRAEDIDLVSLKEFYSEAPAEISRPDVTKEDEHQQMLARLEWELELRKTLTATLEEQDLIKQQNSSVIEKSHDTLNQLKPLLSKVLESLQPISVELDIPMDNNSKKSGLEEMDTGEVVPDEEPASTKTEPEPMLT